MAWPNPGRPVLTSFLGSVRRVQRSVTQMPAALSGSEHSRTRKIPRHSKAMTHAGSRESIVGEARQGWAMDDPALYPSWRSILPVSKITSTTAQSLQAKTYSLQLDATDLPPPGFLGPLQGLPLPGEVRSLGVVPVPEGHQRTIPIGILRPWWQL